MAQALVCEREEQDSYRVHRRDGLVIASLSILTKVSTMDIVYGTTEEGEWYYVICQADGTPFLTFAQLGDYRVLYGGILTNDVIWPAGGGFLEALGTQLPGVRQEYERIMG